MPHWRAPWRGRRRRLFSRGWSRRRILCSRARGGGRGDRRLREVLELRVLGPQGHAAAGAAAASGAKGSAVQQVSRRAEVLGLRGKPAPVYLIAGQQRTDFGPPPSWAVELVPPG